MATRTIHTFGFTQILGAEMRDWYLYFLNIHSEPGIKYLFVLQINSASKKTLNFSSGFLEDAKDKAFEALKTREFIFVNDRFQNENNAVFGVF